MPLLFRAEGGEASPTNKEKRAGKGNSTEPRINKLAMTNRTFSNKISILSPKPHPKLIAYVETVLTNLAISFCAQAERNRCQAHRAQLMFVQNSLAFTAPGTTD